MSRGWYSFKRINEIHIFVKILVSVVFGNSLPDKQTLVFGTALTRNHLAAMVYCQALMSQQVSPKA